MNLHMVCLKAYLKYHRHFKNDVHLRGTILAPCNSITPT